MIWFNCKKCNKTHSRSDSAAGSMIFCDCGQGLLVPWSSTIPEPADEEPAIPLPTPPRSSAPLPPSRAVPVDDADRPRRPSIPVPSDPPDSPWSGRRSRVSRKINPAYCFNHEESASGQTCADCRLPFCSACVVSFQGQMLCGPCKNFRIRGVTRPPRTSGMAIVALVAAVASGPVAMCLGVLPTNTNTNPNGSVALTVVFLILGMLLPAGALVLGGFALRDVETKPNVSGRGLAMTAGITALAGLVWNLTIGMLMILKHVQS